MPISGVVIRVAAGTDLARVSSSLGACAHVELGEGSLGALSAVIDAPDYPSHDRALTELGNAVDVCAVDIVFHDFSDVTDFESLPRKQRSTR
jgi:nitrate reductase NapAB chaperone NapD